jgi:putative restriction endonuclease
MREPNWSRNELIASLNLYYKLGFAAVKYTNPKIIELAHIIGRSPSAVAFKLVNFARLDPELQKRGVKGMSHGSKAEEPIWKEFYGKLEELVEVSELLLAKFKGIPLEVSASIDTYDLPREGKERKTVVMQRVNQSFFREMILSLYKNTCCITGINNPSILVASHISEWAKDKENRLKPGNGLCLNSLHDKAYEKGLISITPDYKIKVSSILKREKKSKPIKDYFLQYENKAITFPNKYQPIKELLELHLRNRFIK